MKTTKLLIRTNHSKYSIFIGSKLISNLSKIIENIVININDKLVLNDRLDEEKTLGIIRKIEKGFITPPEK